jgi:hypothetical protein
MASAAAAIDQPSLNTRRTSSARLRGELAAFLCMSIWAPPCDLFVLKAFRIAEVARMDNSYH